MTRRREGGGLTGCLGRLLGAMALLLPFLAVSAALVGLGRLIAWLAFG